MAGPKKTKSVTVRLTEEQHASASGHAGGESRIAALFRALLSMLDSGQVEVNPSDIDKHSSPAAGRGRKPRNPKP